MKKVIFSTKKLIDFQYQTTIITRWLQFCCCCCCCYNSLVVSPFFFSTKFCLSVIRINNFIFNFRFYFSILLTIKCNLSIKRNPILMNERKMKKKSNNNNNNNIDGQGQFPIKGRERLLKRRKSVATESKKKNLQSAKKCCA